MTEEARNCGALTRAVGAVTDRTRSCGALPRAVGAVTEEARSCGLLPSAAGAVTEAARTLASWPSAVGAVTEEGWLCSAEGGMTEEARSLRHVKAVTDDVRTGDGDAVRLADDALAEVSGTVTGACAAPGVAQMDGLDPIRSNRGLANLRAFSVAIVFIASNL